MTQELKCFIDGCEKKVKKHDRYCSMHRARFSRTNRFDKKTPYERMMERVEIKKNGCWIYTGFVNEYGYGRIRNNGFKYLTHRLSFEHFFGSIPEGILVCHKCDIPSCVNPQHLFLGTHKDNFDDALKKGRRNPVEQAKNRWKKCPTLRKK